MGARVAIDAEGAPRVDVKSEVARRIIDAMEELTAELASAIACAEAGINGTHANGIGHASYLKSWIKVLERDPMSIFTAAKAAERVSDYMLSLSLKLSTLPEHGEWIAEYERSAAPGR